LFVCEIRDEDMQSLASLMSSAQSDIAPLDDLDGDEEGICKFKELLLNKIF
jgi:hypothetical protein